MTDTAAVGYLHLTLHLVNGGRIQFAQLNPESAQSILDQMRPERLFSQKQLLISGNDAVTIIPSENIERIDLRCEPLPHWPYTGPVTSVYEIPAEDFQRLQRREPPLPVPGHPLPQTPPRQAGVLVELRSGAVVCLSVKMQRSGSDSGSDEAPTPEDTRLFFQHLFTRPLLHAKLDDDQGILLLNPANALRFTLTPPPPEPSAGAWLMEMTAAA